MTASHLVYDSSEHHILSNFDSIDRDSESFQALCNVAILCSRATFVNGNMYFVIILFLQTSTLKGERIGNLIQLKKIITPIIFLT